MSSHTGPRETIQILERLKEAIEELGSRARMLDEELRTRRARERSLYQRSLADLAAQFGQANEAAAKQHSAAQAALETRREARKLLIPKTHQAALEWRLRQVEDRTGACKYELQKRMLQAEKERDAGLANNLGCYESLKTRLAAEQDLLAVLEQDALRAFGGYRKLLRQFTRAYNARTVDLSPDESQLIETLHQVVTQARDQLARFAKGWILLRIFRKWWLWLALAAAEFGLVPISRHTSFPPVGYPVAAGVVGATAAGIWILRALAQSRARAAAASISELLARGRALYNGAADKADTRYQATIEKIHADYQRTAQDVDTQHEKALREARDLEASWRSRCDDKARTVIDRNQRLGQIRSERLNLAYRERLECLQREGDQKKNALTEASQSRERALDADHAARWQIIASEWQARLTPLYAAVEAINLEAVTRFPPWPAPVWRHWVPPKEFENAALFAHLGVDVAALCKGTPQDSRLPLPGPSSFSLALSLVYPEAGSLIIETGDSGREEAIGALNNVVLRLLASAPPGRLNFTVIDPVGLGQNFAGIMHLADYEEQIIKSRIWTQSGQIEQRLGELNEQMEKVIQMYLRNDYATIAEYNEQAGVIAEKFHFLVVADFPAAFTETAAKRLMSVAASGARCGVYMLIHWDRRQPSPQELIPEDFRKSAFGLVCKAGEMAISSRPLPGVRLAVDPPPPPELAIDLIHQIGLKSRDSCRVEVPFAHVAPGPGLVWTLDTTEELRVPVGRTGATKLQYLALGKGTRQHGLVAGKTGSGKSTLFHVIITNLALWCSPEAVEFYLVDFKKGVEFKCYAANRLPHARVVAIESDREFGLSVLQRLDEELKRRGDRFRDLGVQDLPGYKRAGGSEPLPRSLLIIDEFQEFFVEDDKIAQTASLLLDRIVRQGRAFGIHVILGSQTLGGAYTVARTTLGQMVVRIALQCNEADAYLIMDDNNPAPRLLSRPGEGIYNDMAGMIEGNSPFQVVWLPDQVRNDRLEEIRARADADGADWAGPIVFEGNAPADVRENLILSSLLDAPARQPAPAPRIWLGLPNSIKGPTEVIFYRRSGANLLLVGQREEATLAILSLGLIALAAQHPPGTAKFILCDGTAPGSAQRAFLEQIVQAIPHPVNVARQGDLPDIMAELGRELKRRTDSTDSETAPAVFLFLHGLQKYPRLRYEDDFSFATNDPDAPPNPAVVLNALICDGARFGFHVIASCDTYNTVNRSLSRKAISEFELRVLFQMSANDSASLIDNPKASQLGLYRALLFNQQEGQLETFRPYALPPLDWVAQLPGRLARLVADERNQRGA